MQSSEVIVGVDVASKTLACSIGSTGTSCSNDVAGIRQLLGKVPPGSVIAMEATGSYSELLAHMAHAAGMTVFVLNAKDVYFYAKALGSRGKTDPGDAAIIERYVTEHRARLHPWTPGTLAQRQLQDLVRRRGGITGHRASLRQMLSGQPNLRTSFKALEQQFDGLLADIDRQIQALIDADADMKQASEALQTITGIKLVGSALLISLFSRIRFANVDAVIAYSGLDPRPNDSGQRRGRRVLSKKGPPELRRQLFLAAFSSARSKAFRPAYQALRARGFESTEAFVILARKILRIAWAVWNTRKPFEPALVNPKLA